MVSTGHILYICRGFVTFSGVNVFRKENGKWKVSFLAFYATPKLPASADE